MPGRPTIAAVALLALATTVRPSFIAAAPQIDTLRRLGRVSQQLTPDDLIDIKKLVSSRGRPWFVIAGVPSRTASGATWRWTAEVYLFPTGAVSGKVVRGNVCLVRADLPGPASYAADKTWELSTTIRTYADVPTTGSTVNFLITSDLDPRRPFITKPSDRYGQISDADLIALIEAVRASESGSVAISEVTLIDPNLATVLALQVNPLASAPVSLVMRRRQGTWVVDNAVEHRAASPAAVGSQTAWGTAPRISTWPAAVVALLAVGLNAFGLWVVFSGWKAGRGSPQFILALLPASLICLLAPAPVVLLQIIGGFSHFAAMGGNGAAMLANCQRGFLVSGFGFVLSLAAAAALQWHAGWVDESSETTAGSSRPAKRWQAMVLAVTPIVALPAIAFGVAIEYLPRLIMERALLVRRPGTSPTDLSQMSRTISSWLMLGFFGSIAAAFFLALVGVMTLILVRSNRFSPRLATYAWIVFAVVGLLAAWNLSRVVSDLDWLSTTATRPPQ